MAETSRDHGTTLLTAAYSYANMQAADAAGSRSCSSAVPQSRSPAVSKSMQRSNQGGTLASPGEQELRPFR